MKNKAGFLSAFIVMSIAVVFFVYSLMYPYTSDIGPGPGFLPFWLSIALFVLSISYMYVVFKGEDSVEPMPGKQGRKNIVFILSCMIVFVVMLPLLGFIVSGTVFLYVLFIKNYRWHIALFTALGTSVFLFLLFSKFLQVNLPVNMFGF